MGMFDAIFGGTDTSALTGGANQAKGFIKKGIKLGTKSIDKAREHYTPEFNAAADAFAPYQQMGQQLSGLYTDALGGNGQAGYDNAVGAFHHNPGWDFALNEANQNVLRNQAATGALNSGATLQGLSDRAQGLQNQEYQQWLDNLFRGGSQGLLGAQGYSGAKQNLGQAFQESGNQKANIQTGGFGALATNASNLGAGLQSQTAADQASQLSLLNSILGVGSAFAGRKTA